LHCSAFNVVLRMFTTALYCLNTYVLKVAYLGNAGTLYFINISCTLGPLAVPLLLVLSLDRCRHSTTTLPPDLLINVQTNVKTDASVNKSSCSSVVQHRTQTVCAQRATVAVVFLQPHT
jgi:hypothetical protein